ncbi:hypothetical protein [Streptomyces sp. Tue 6075]|nr:hypothetical protein [Streptomyces sp. Tue 6075]
MPPSTRCYCPCCSSPSCRGAWAAARAAQAAHRADRHSVGDRRTRHIP